ncbi:MAG: hypothetical protein EOP88_01450 [Verrucomicrobiaceae bacterium]|nr:MAG: hypothetical protein EOP88_01450 [Verrucomicrobiaceae bacterium]
MHKVSFSIAVAMWMACPGSWAEETVLQTIAPSHAWEFRAEPYAWLTNVEGTIGVGGFSTTADLGFFDSILENLKMAAALQLEARRGPWGIIADGFYSELGFTAETPGPLYESVSAEYQQFFGELAIAYRVHEDPCLFVDVYAGLRYTDLSLELEARESPADITTFSTNVTTTIVDGSIERADAIVEPRIEEYKTAPAARRAEIEADIRSSVEAASERRAKRVLKRQLERIHDGKRVHLKMRELIHAVSKERARMAKAAAQLKVAELRASVNAALQNKVTEARQQLANAEKDLATSLDEEISGSLPAGAKGRQQWVDPFIGVRTQWNFSGNWFLAAKGDIGGFGVGADLTWSAQATVGYEFTPQVSAELGYRHLFTDYSDGGFIDKVDQSGIFTGLNVRF